MRTIRSTHRGLLILGMLVGSLMMSLTTTLPAHAERATVTDRAGDGYADRWGDIRSVQVRHRDSNVRFATTFARDHSANTIRY